MFTKKQSHFAVDKLASRRRLGNLSLFFTPCLEFEELRSRVVSVVEFGCHIVHCEFLLFIAMMWL